MKKLAFTLLELSVSLAIIASIAGIILAGNNFHNQSKLRAVVKEFQVLNNAITIFRDRYGYLPGDLPNPPTSWSATGGDGDGSVFDHSDLERNNAWHHLYMSGLINQPFPKYVTDPDYNFYQSIYKPGIYDFRYGQIFVTNSTWLEFGLLDGNVASYPILKPKDAYYIDNKIDDGIANFGIVLGSDGDEVSEGECSAVFTNTSTSAINYNFSMTNITCRLFHLGNPLF